MLALNCVATSKFALLSVPTKVGSATDMPRARQMSRVYAMSSCARDVAYCSPMCVEVTAHEIFKKRLPD